MKIQISVLFLERLRVCLSLLGAVGKVEASLRDLEQAHAQTIAKLKDEQAQALDRVEGELRRRSEIFENAESAVRRDTERSGALRVFRAVIHGRCVA